MLITLASVPAAHPYVDGVVDRESIVLLRDPTPPGATLPDQWWPSQWLNIDYLRNHLHLVDVLHVHFGFDTEDPRDLGDVVALLRSRDVPLIVTVHDLHNPHFREVAAHAKRLDVLVPAAETVITLTAGAAAEIRRRWDRDAIVLPHPHVLPIDEVGAARPVRDVPVVAVHAKALRANVDPWPVLDALVAADRRSWRLRLELGAGAPATRVAAGRLDAYRAAGVDVRIQPRFDDADMVEYLRGIDVMVLPYLFGTHSGWVEACHDAGVATVVPECGYFREQHGAPTFGFDESHCDGEAVRLGVDAALRQMREAGAGVDLDRRQRRAVQRRIIRREVESIYRRALSGRAAA